MVSDSIAGLLAQTPSWRARFRTQRRLPDRLRDGILPFIDAGYRTDVPDRTLWGHSLSGVFARDLLPQSPCQFHRYLTTSPGVVLDGQILIRPVMAELNRRFES